MDPTQFPANGAVAQPSYADPGQGTPAESQVAGDNQGQPGAADASATPPPPTDSIDYRAALEALVPRYQQYEQAFGELRQMMAAAQQQQAETEFRTAAQQRIDRAYQIAETMPPEDAFRYIRQVEDQERAGLHQTIQQVRQQAQVQTYQVAAQISAPLYAIELGKRYSLPPDMVDRLQTIGDPRQMDGYLPALRAELSQRQQSDQKYQALLTQIDQLQRSQQANALDASGAHNPGNPGAPTITTPSGTFEAGSRDHLLSKLPPGFFGGGSQ